MKACSRLTGGGCCCRGRCREALDIPRPRFVPTVTDAQSTQQKSKVQPDSQSIFPVHVCPDENVYVEGVLYKKGATLGRWVPRYYILQVLDGVFMLCYKINKSDSKVRMR